MIGIKINHPSAFPIIRQGRIRFHSQLLPGDFLFPGLAATHHKQHGTGEQVIRTANPFPHFHGIKNKIRGRFVDDFTQFLFRQPLIHRNYLSAGSREGQENGDIFGLVAKQNQNPGFAVDAPAFHPGPQLPDLSQQFGISEGLVPPDYRGKMGKIPGVIFQNPLKHGYICLL